MKSLCRVLFLFSIVFAASFSACSDSKSDSDQGIKQLRKAAEQGHADAQYFLGHCYHNGKGVEQDDVKAAEWWRKAADQGFELAKEYLEKLEN